MAKIHFYLASLATHVFIGEEELGSEARRNTRQQRGAPDGAHAREAGGCEARTSWQQGEASGARVGTACSHMVASNWTQLRSNGRMTRGSDHVWHARITWPSGHQSDTRRFSGIATQQLRTRGQLRARVTWQSLFMRNFSKNVPNLVKSITFTYELHFLRSLYARVEKIMLYNFRLDFIRKF